MYKKLVDSISMSEVIPKHLKPVGTRPRIMYGSFKVHKKYFDHCSPFRPILSALQTLTYKLAKLSAYFRAININKYTQ